MQSAQIHFSLHPMSTRAAETNGKSLRWLERAWRDLEKGANNSYFVSWRWVSLWLDVMCADFHVIQGCAGDKIVSLGVLIEANQRRHKVLAFKQCRLQSTGNVARDQIWPEYNGMLVASGYEGVVYDGVVRFLEQQKIIDWDELVVGPLDDAALSLINECGTSAYEFSDAPMYQVDLNQIRLDEKTYLDSLSKNTRQQIRRSINRYQKEAPLQFDRAATVDDALTFLGHISEIHKEKWKGESGFYNEYFTTFHRRLVEENFLGGTIEIVALRTAEGDTLGYLYNFLYKGTVYFYLSGVRKSAENKLKPGLVLHALCIQEHLDKGYGSYDFLAGDSQYKRSLATLSGRQKIIFYQKPNTMNRIESTARRWKQWLLDADGGRE